MDFGERKENALVMAVRDGQFEQPLWWSFLDLPIRPTATSSRR
jgi:hypothetical protein